MEEKFKQAFDEAKEKGIDNGNIEKDKAKLEELIDKEQNIWVTFQNLSSDFRDNYNAPADELETYKQKVVDVLDNLAELNEQVASLANQYEVSINKGELPFEEEKVDEPVTQNYFGTYSKRAQLTNQYQRESTVPNPNVVHNTDYNTVQNTANNTVLNTVPNAAIKNEETIQERPQEEEKTGIEQFLDEQPKSESKLSENDPIQNKQEEPISSFNQIIPQEKKGFFRRMMDKIRNMFGRKSKMIDSPSGENKKIEEKEKDSNFVEKIPINQNQQLEMVKKYFYILHPDFDSLQPDEKRKYYNDIIFMKDNIEKIDNYYKDYTKQGGMSERIGLNNKETVHAAIRLTKADNYFSILHPDYSTLSTEEQQKLKKEISYIDENLENIEEYYKTCKANGSIAKTNGWTEQEIVENAIKGVPLPDNKDEASLNQEDNKQNEEKNENSHDDTEL